MPGRLRTTWAGLLGLALVYGGSVLAQPDDAGRPDAGRPTADAGRVDAGRPTADAGRAVDAGTSADAGRAVDAGRSDAGLAAAVDAGTEPASDAGTSADAGTADAGVAVDAEGESSLVETAVEITREPTTSEVVRTLLGLLALLALAWLGGLPGVRRLEERLGISQVVTSGLPFVGLGLLMHAPGVDVLSENVLTSITPLLQFGLGWIGFHTGFQFEARGMNEVPRGTGSVVVMLTSFPFALIAALAAVLMIATGLWDPEAFGDRAWRTLARDACLLGLAGALSAPIASTLAKPGGKGPELAATVAVLDDVFGVFALALLSAWLRPVHEGGWQLPGVGWLFVTLGMAATLGLVVHFALLTAESTGERTALLLGSVAFTAGLAGYASISPLVVCFLAGIVLRNVPGGNKTSFEAAFVRLERPVYLLFLTIAGALWRIDDWRGWALLVVFLVARLVGRAIGARFARRLPQANRPPSLATTPDRELVLAPMGHLAIAFVVAAQTLYESPAIRAIVTAVIGGSIVSEIMARFATQRPQAEEEAGEGESEAAEPAEAAAPPDAADGPEPDAPSAPDASETSETERDTDGEEP